MMSKIKVKLNRKEIGSWLKSKEMRQTISDGTDKVKKRLRTGLDDDQTVFIEEDVTDRVVNRVSISNYKTKDFLEDKINKLM